MFLLTFFIFPITAGGLLKGFSSQMADTFVLNLPQMYGSPWLALLVFIGGLSASTGMIMVSSMTLSTMVTNNLILPVLGVIKNLSFLRRYLLQLRWAAVGLVLFLGYLFERSVGESYFLASMGGNFLCGCASVCTGYFGRGFFGGREIKKVLFWG